MQNSKGRRRSAPRIPRALLYALIAFCAVLLIVMPIRAMMNANRSEDAGYVVDSRFSTYYEGQGGLKIFGPPISEAFTDPQSGMIVQYFANARIELASEGSSAKIVRTSPLGMMLGGWEYPLSEPREDEGCRYYAETGHQVCHTFLEFYIGNGGPGVFGYPISEFRLEENLMVQYFQWMRLDWNPRGEEDEPVRPGPLGRIHLQSIQTELPEPTDEALAEVEDLILTTSVAQPAVGTSDEQTLYLLVRDQELNPVEGAAGVLVAHFPDGDRTLVMPFTDENGRSQVTFSFEDQPTGTSVLMEIDIVYGDLRKSTRESFMIYLPELD
ncbi:MAG: hypothetical protein GTO18_02455 [Anaerolineales bacterium]|nr:hypothetical protein [Anaerolineales bacterium]